MGLLESARENAVDFGLHADQAFQNILQGLITMSNPNIEWDSGKEMFIAWDEACMPIGYYDTREEAEREFEEYCAHLFPPSEYPEMHKGKSDVRNDSDRSD